MIGDSPIDLEAAREAGALFLPHTGISGKGILGNISRGAETVSGRKL